MKNFVTINLLALGLLTAGCSSKGVPIEYSNACLPENDGKYVEIGGYLDPGGSIFCSNTGGGPVKCQLVLKAEPGGAAELSVYIVEGDSANNVEKPESGFKKEEIEVYDDTGSRVSFTEKVRVTGEMRVAQTEKVCYMRVAKIEK
jgi:hypothetical protein